MSTNNNRYDNMENLNTELAMGSLLDKLPVGTMISRLESSIIVSRHTYASIFDLFA